MYYKPGERGLPILRNLPENTPEMLVALAAVLALVLISLLLYQPFASWYASGILESGALERDAHRLTAYLTHWGLFLFLIVCWMVWETRDWMATTPLSALRKLEPHRIWIYTALAVLLLVVAGLFFLGAAIAWFVLPLAAWAGVLLLRPGMPDAKRFVLFLVGTALILTLMVEVIVLVGDIGRMNTVFKFYLQAWTLLSISAAAALGWLVMALPAWSPRWRLAWQVVADGACGGRGAVYADGEHGKDQGSHGARGAAYPGRHGFYAGMPNITDTWGAMDLSQDYRAIRWMQENVQGSPVIVEANLRDLYRWGSRFSIYTGLPGVVGWEWHQQQQRAVLPGNWVSDRIAEIDNFYTGTDLAAARDFLRKYNVRYIILGQQERGKYPGPGLDKFPAADGSLWRSVYQDGDTVIYEVIDLGEEGS